MVWKKVPPGDAGATDIFGGDDMNKVSDAFSGADVDDIDLNSDFTVRSGKRKLRNPANTFSYIEAAGGITADRIVNEPILLADDTRVYQGHAQPLFGKTISGANNTLSNIPMTAIDHAQPYSYIIYKEGSTYYAKSKNYTNLSNSNFVTVIQAAIYAISTGAGNPGGGKIFLKNGLYPQSTTPIHIGNTIYPASHVVIEGEDKYSTIIQSQTNDVDMFQLWCHTTFRNFTMDGNNLAKRIVITGQPHTTEIFNCVIKKHNDIGVQILNGGTGLRVTNCDFIEPNGWQDQLAYATSYWAIIENNYLDKVTFGPGIPGGGGASLTSGGASYARVTGNVIKRLFGSDPHGAITFESWGQHYNQYICSHNLILNGDIWIGSSLASNQHRYAVISDNVLLGGRIFSIAVIPFADLTRHITISGNIIANSNYGGIDVRRISGPLRIEGNQILDSNQSLAVDTFLQQGCLYLEDVTDAEVVNNTVKMTDTRTNASSYGMRALNCTNVRFRFNNIINSTAKPSWSVSGGTNIKLFGNTGYVTEAEGATSIADGGTITHGLATTPTVVTVSARVAGEFASVTARTATTFTVAIKKYVTGTLTAGTTQIIDWRASI